MDTATYTLTGINYDQGGTCDHCGRTLKHLFGISNGETAMVVGRSCCKKITGWTPQAAQALFLLRQSRRYIAHGYTALEIAEDQCHGLRMGVESEANHVAHGARRLAEARADVAAMGMGV